MSCIIRLSCHTLQVKEVFAMQRKMLFFDIDGTILTEGTPITPDSAVEAIRAARKAGHYTFINTGRTRFNIEPKLCEIGFDGYVCGCGTYIYFHDQKLFSQSVPAHRCHEIIQLLRDCNIQALFEENSRVFFDNYISVNNKKLEELRARFGSKSIEIPETLDQSSIIFDKFVIWLNTRSDEASFRSGIAPDFDYIDRGNGFAEIVPKGCSKASGIAFLMNHLHIPITDCYAFGDSTNDLSMLEFVPNSIAMGNSMKEILPYCSYQTTDVLDDGIARALKHFHIIP